MSTWYLGFKVAFSLSVPTNIIILDILHSFSDCYDGKNIKASVQGAGLVPLDPKSVISKLDIRLRTPTPPPVSLDQPELWASKTAKLPD
jgi:hypothetical protein